MPLFKNHKKTEKTKTSTVTEADVNKLFFGDHDLLQDETIPIDRKKNIETIFSFLGSDKISPSMKLKVAAAMKDAVT